jgi:flagella basal body P-ring formation protein FlgA
VDGERITMGDLASADARFGAADGAKSAGFAPEPGAKRVFWAAELLRLARREGIEDGEPFHPACFERRTRLLTSGEIEAAVRSWAPSDAQVTVVEQSRFPAPAGELTIPKPSAARAGADGSVLLRGYVRFGAGQRFPVWTRVRVKVARTMVVTSQEIAAGTQVLPEQLRLEQRDGGLETGQFASVLEQVSGKVTRKHLPPGAPVLLTSLEAPKEVKNGAMVRVEVRDGAARLEFDGRAETGGRTGEMVTVRNPSSGKAFQARVTGEATVLVTPRGKRSGEMDGE